MPGNTIGTLFRVTTFGESHGSAVGAVLDGLPPGMPLDMKTIQRQLDRRRPGHSSVSSPRNEPDTAEILSGIFEGKTTGTPMCLLIRNRDAQPGSYDDIRDLFRPGHADRSYLEKYGIRDHRGGGRSSGRETAARVAAGAVAMEILKGFGISITACTIRAAGIPCRSYDPLEIERNPMYAPDMNAAEEMVKAIERIAAAGDSAGGIIECRVAGCPAGLGEPVFGKLDAELAGAVLSIGAVKGIEFGAGFSAADMRGSENNDQMDRTGYLTNNAGGILGGISTGQEIRFTVAVKPTPSISRGQKTVDTQGREREISVGGRHDACICPRIVPVVEAMTAMVLTDHLMRSRALVKENQTE